MTDRERRKKGAMLTETDPSSRILTGRCECGITRYRVPDAFMYAANCHCSNCRASTGSAFKPFAGIRRDKLEVVDASSYSPASRKPIERRRSWRRRIASA